MDSWSRWSRTFPTLGSRSGFCLFLVSVSGTHLSFQNHTLVTGGEDGKVNLWPIHPVELESEELVDGDGADGDELMDVDIPSPKGRKRERTGGNELVCFSNTLESTLFLIDVICVIARQTSQTLTDHGVSCIKFSSSIYCTYFGWLAWMIDLVSAKSCNVMVFK